MNFQEAELLYQALEKRWAAGQVDLQAYLAALDNLRVTDADGAVWMPQEHSGRWFVYRAGQWVEGQRPQTTVPPPPPKPRRRITSLLLISGLLGLCLVCVALGAAAYFFYPGEVVLPSELSFLFPQTGDQDPEAQPAGAAPAPPASKTVIQPAEALSIAADGAPHADAHGVQLLVPADALEKGGQVKLTANDLEAAWRKPLETVVGLDTRFYRLEAQGKNDTPGSLGLSFPAASPKARLLAVIDNDYLVELAQVPQNGRLTLQTRAGPSDPADLQPPKSYDGTGSIYYAVITPKSASRLNPAEQPVSWHPQADERNCIPDLSLIGGAAINLCRQNAAGTLQVMLPTTQRGLVAQVDLMVDKIEAVMKKYNDLGFTSAQLSHSSPMLVRVSTKVTSPSYYPLNGVLYIPVDTVTHIASLSPTDVYHEMAHWIQAVKYSTRLAYWSGEKTWWLETSAENMVMLVEPGYVGGNLRTYGTISNADNSLAFQSRPYQWPGDYYVQAQLVKVNLCDSPACPLSPASFAKAISEGSYPLMNGAMKAQVNANLKDYAFYLLGKPPAAANSAIPLNGPVKTGDGYGEYVRVARTTSADLKYDFNGTAPQMTKETKDNKETLAIQAKLQEDGVYPLVVLGGQGKNAGLPVELDIEPGAPFYYTLDDGALKYSDGSKELKLLPIHGDLGIKKVRVVAIGENGGEVFKARVMPLDLQGAWVVMASGAKTGGSMTCSGKIDNPDGTAQLMAYVMEIASGTGDMKADSTGRNLDWNEVASRVPGELKKGKMTFKATTLLAGDGIQLEASVDLPKDTQQSSLPPAATASAILILPLLWLNRKRLNLRTVRVLTNVLVIAFLVLVSSGCFGMGMYGAATLNGKFTKIEYVGGQDTGQLAVSKQFSGAPTGKPIWKLTGTGIYDVNFTIEATTTDANGKDNTDINTCTGKVTFPISAYVYKDFAVQMPAK